MSRSITASAPVNRWTLERFGLTPSKLRHRVLGAGGPKVLCISIPKAGTHLLERALCLHPALYRKLVPTVSEANLHRWGGLDGLLARLRQGQIVVSHLRYRPEHLEVIERRGVRPIFLICDPHDIVVSQVHYVSRRSDHRSHRLFRSMVDDRERLRLAIVGDPSHDVASIGERLDRFAGWLPNSLVVRFEDLVGPDGGGDRARQLAALRDIDAHLGLNAGEDATAAVAGALFSRQSPTFRSGAIGGWRSSFDPDLEATFDAVVGDRLGVYGYDPANEV